MKITAYYKLVILSNDLKLENGIKVGAKIPRYDCTKYTGGYQGINPLINKKGMLMLYLMDSENIINAESKRMSEFVLKGRNSLNFSSLYFEDVSNPNLCYGYPNGKPMLRNGSANPLFKFRQDLYLIIMKEDFTELEILVFENQKGFASDFLQCLSEGDFDSELEMIRSKSIMFKEY